MKIGIAAPVETSSITDLLGAVAKDAPAGYPGAPLIGVLARSLMARGHQVSLYTTDSSLLPTIREPLVVHGEHITVYYCPSRPRSFRLQHGMPGRMLDCFKFERRGLLAAIEQDNPEVVHGHWGYEFAWAAMDSQRPNVLSFHDSPRQILRYLPNLYRLGRYFMARRTVRDAQFLTTVSPYMQHELSNWCGRVLEVVPNPIEEAWFSMATTPEDRDLTKPKIAMVINGWDDLKNAKPALKAFSKVRALNTASELHLFGNEFGDQEEAQRWCQENQLDANVVFHGRVSYQELRQLLAGMTLLVHPSLEESFGMTIAEAMALALPVIGGANSGAVPWICEGGKAGVLVDVCSEQAIADAVLQLISNTVKYAELAKIAQQSIQVRFSAAAVAEAYEDCYVRAMLRGSA